MSFFFFKCNSFKELCLSWKFSFKNLENNVLSKITTSNLKVMAILIDLWEVITHVYMAQLWNTIPLLILYHSITNHCGLCTLNLTTWSIN